MKPLLATAAAILIALPIAASPESRQRRSVESVESEVWIFDRLDRIGGHPTTVLGHPRVIESPRGNAIEFNGVDDALFVDVHPLAGAETWTWEAVFRPDGGAAEQRWFHLQESDSDHRMLFEIRVIDGQWCLDAYVHSSSGQRALMDRGKLHAVGAWYHVAAVYDGRAFRNYVDGVEQGAAEIVFTPQRAGRSSIGVRINRVNYFKGAIRLARFTRRALAPTEFLRGSGSGRDIARGPGSGRDMLQFRGQAGTLAASPR